MSLARRLAALDGSGGRAAPGATTRAGRPVSTDPVVTVKRSVRQALVEIAGPDRAASTRVLYGGSVKSTNIASFLREPDVDGALVGGASLDVSEFTSIVRFRSHVGV